MATDDDCVSQAPVWQTLCPASVEVGVSVIRVFSFLAARQGFDDILRKVFVPDLTGRPGIVDCYVGRQGPDDVGPRIVVTTWTTREAMVDTLGDGLGVFHPEYLDATTNQVLEILEARIDWRAGAGPPGEPPRILRLLRGEVRSGELDAYVDDVRHGVQADADAGHGPTTLYLGLSGTDTFMTVSAWREWAHIERATGGNVSRPLVTRHPERLAAWQVELYELI
jgi:hypothetical protein